MSVCSSRRPASVSGLPTSSLHRTLQRLYFGLLRHTSHWCAMYSVRCGVQCAVSAAVCNVQCQLRCAMCIAGCVMQCALPAAVCNVECQLRCAMYIVSCSVQCTVSAAVCNVQCQLRCARLCTAQPIFNVALCELGLFCTRHWDCETKRKGTRVYIKEFRWALQRVLWPYLGTKLRIRPVCIVIDVILCR
jgi:hypothetical protein